VAGAHPHDGRRAAVPRRSDFQDGEHAVRVHAAKDVADAYVWGWKLGLKAIAIYRDGSKQSQPLSTQTEADKAAGRLQRPRRERLPDTRQSITHKFNVGGHEGYINVGLYPDGRPGELFLTMAKEGSTVGGLMDSFGTAISMSLQYGVPLEVLVHKFSHTRFEPMGQTTNPDIRIAKSIVDYIFRWLGITFLPGFREANGILPAGPKSGKPGDRKPSKIADRESGSAKDTAPPAHADSGPDRSRTQPGSVDRRPSAGPSVGESARRSKSAGNGHAPSDPSNGNGTATAVGEHPESAVDWAMTGRSGFVEQFAGFQSDAPACDNCGSITVRNGNCYLCHNCGNSMGCS